MVSAVLLFVSLQTVYESEVELMKAREDRPVASAAADTSKSLTPT